ncbi:MAG TPA: hypothetical protein VNR18_04285, partial [Hyphomicrobiales bacterium]|nr:hypothetical protein [Hyphomicrobiales bacterium]
MLVWFLCERRRDSSPFQRLRNAPAMTRLTGIECNSYLTGEYLLLIRSSRLSGHCVAASWKDYDFLVKLDGAEFAALHQRHQVG